MFLATETGEPGGSESTRLGENRAARPQGPGWGRAVHGGGGGGPDPRTPGCRAVGAGGSRAAGLPLRFLAPEPTLQVRTSRAGACLPKAGGDIEAQENRLGAEYGEKAKKEGGL